MSNPPTDRRVRVQEKFDILGLGPVGHWLAVQRTEGRSWVDISFEIRTLAGFTVSHETLRRWWISDEESSE
jgi:hypothetical protein